MEPPGLESGDNLVTVEWLKDLHPCSPASAGKRGVPGRSTVGDGKHPSSFPGVGENEETRKISGLSSSEDELEVAMVEQSCTTFLVLGVGL